MSTPKKKAVVTKRPSAEQVQDSEKWNAFVTASQIEWDDLSEEYKDFFEVVGNTKSSSEEEIHNLVERGGLDDDMFFSLHTEALDELSKTETAYNAVISYMLGKGYCEEPLEFLRCWNEGNFEALREEWPDAPEEIYLADPLGSNPLYKGSK